MSYNLTGATVSSTFQRLVQVVLGSPNTYYDGLGNLLNIGSGATGPTGPSGTSINWAGDWDPMMIYFEYDVVFYNGSSYICINAPTGGAPYPSPDNDPTSWNILSSIGATGSYSPFYFQQNPPSPNPTVLGSRWIDSDTGREYVWVYDGANYLWVQPTQLVSMRNSTYEVSTATYSADFTYEYLGVVYNSGVCEITLPVGTFSNDGQYITVTDEVGGVSNYGRGIKVQPVGGQLINGQTDVMMKIERMSLTFMYRNSSWKII